MNRVFIAAAKELLEAGNSYDKTEKLLVPIAKKLGVSSISKSKLNRQLPKSALVASSHHSLPEVSSAQPQALVHLQIAGFANFDNSFSRP
jgi:hypothetical protein